MILDNPITFTPKPITKLDGSIKTFDPITIEKLNFLLIDNSKEKYVYAQIEYCPRPLVLWSNEDYDEIGDWTQDQAENRIKELLGNNASQSLEDLF